MWVTPSHRETLEDVEMSLLANGGAPTLPQCQSFSTSRSTVNNTNVAVF